MIAHSANKATYQSIPDESPVDVENHHMTPVSVKSSSDMVHVTIVYWSVFTFTFLFYGYCVLHTFLPQPLWVLMFDSTSGHRMLEESIGTADNTCTAAGIAELAVAGAVAGAAIITVGFIAVGLTPFVGPAAGGLFAANMGSGVVAGSAMAAAQSASMTAGTYATAAALGGAATPALNCLG